MATAKTIYTGRYQDARRIPADHVLVAISRGLPRFVVLTSLPNKVLFERRLAPSREVMAAAKAGRDWKADYVRELLAKDLADIFQTLPDRCVMLCFEKDWSECHRKLAFEVLAERFGCAGGELFQLERAAPTDGVAKGEREP